MKNFIKNFSQFQRLNEQAGTNQSNHPDGFKPYSEVIDPVFSEHDNLFDLLDGVADRLYENVKNGTLGNGDNIVTQDKVYPMVGIDFVENKISIEVGDPISWEEYDDIGMHDDDVTVSKTISFLMKEEAPGISVSYTGEGDDMEYGPYEDFYDLTDSISQYIINTLEGRPGKERSRTKTELDDFKQEDSGYERPRPEYDDDDTEIDF